MIRSGFVYILASRHNGTLYVGVTSDLERRLWQHRHEGGGFTRRHRVHILVHVERFDDIREAIAREKQLKRWRRAWKTDLIDQHNPTWRDLSPDPHDSTAATAMGPQDGSPRSRG